MQVNNDAELLRRYAVNCSEAAFAELVSRYVNLVYSAALRQLNGDVHLAQDVTQTVFVDLARKAGKLTGYTSVTGWLYTSVRFAAGGARRAQQRRAKRESEAQAMNASTYSDPQPDWDRIMPIVDEAMYALPEKDREAILLRFFQGQTFPALGVVLGVNENAARKRVERALERLKEILARRGVGVSSGLLGGALAAHGTSAAPIGLAAAVTQACLLAAASAPILTLSLTQLMAVSKLKIAGTVMIAGFTAGLIFQANRASQLRSENLALSEKLARLEQRDIHNETGARQVGAEPPFTQEQFQELLRLRGEVGVLKRQLIEAAKDKAPTVVTPDQERKNEEDTEERVGLVKMGHAKVWMNALFRYARKNDGYFPSDFSAAAELLPVALQSSVNPEDPPLDRIEFAAATNHFEIVYDGSLNHLTNWAKTIVIRETTPRQLRDGAWVRTYGFADGHSEIYKSVDGNFERWEKPRWGNP